MQLPTHRFACVAAVAVGSLLVANVRLDAQASGSVDAGVSWVDYEGFLGSGAATVSPSIRYDGLNSSVGASGSYVRFDSTGNHIVQGLAAGAWRTELGYGLRGELSGSAGFNVYQGSNGFGHLLGRTRIHYARRLAGVWIGAATGQIYQESTSATPLEFEIGGWTVYEGVAIGTTAKLARSGDVAYFDVVGTGRWRDEYLELDGSLGWRAWSDSSGKGFFGEVHAKIPIWNRISAQIAGGRYPSDHVRGILSANFVSVGLSLDVFGNSQRTPSAPTTTLFRELERPGTPSAGEARLTVMESLSGLHTVHIEAPEARSVEVTGDFTDWQPVRLRRVRDGKWEASFRITSGIHRVNVRIDGGAWMVPLGLRTEMDDFGGNVGLLVVR